jgi:hypothetical protein
MRRLVGVGALVGCLVAAHQADAFCGFYVAGADAKLFNNATQVVMMRDGTRTVLSMQNNYEGPPEAFALVVPVPVVLQKENVKTLPKALFEKIDQLTAPRLVEYWEQDPCGYGGEMEDRKMARSEAGPMRRSKSAEIVADLGVTVEARFDVGEYDVVVLSAKDSGGLETWLKQEKYAIPAGAEPHLRPYVQAGSKFFVAKVDPKRVTFVKGQAQLSPLRFHYDATEFSLPVKLGLINSRGTQDLVVNILATKRYEAANYPSVTIPTNLDLAEGSKEQFGRFYAALFDRTIEKTPKAVVTEYSWDAGSCDPCPGPALGPDDFAQLGADALPGAAQPTMPRVLPATPTEKGTLRVASQTLVTQRYQQGVTACWQSAQGRKPKPGKVEVRLSSDAGGRITKAELSTNDTGDKEIGECVRKAFDSGMIPPEAGTMGVAYTFSLAAPPTWRSWTITRLHARYGKDALGADLVFKEAEAITGGRETRDGQGLLEHGATTTKGGTNNFQGRYAIRHPWVGPIACKEPRRGVWGGPWYDPSNPYGQRGEKPIAAEKVAFVPRGGVELASFVRTDVPELGVKAGKGPAPELPSVEETTAGATAPAAPSTPAAPTTPSTPRGGCASCATASPARDASSPWERAGDVLVAAMASLVVIARRRRRVPAAVSTRDASGTTTAA